MLAAGGGAREFGFGGHGASVVAAILRCFGGRATELELGAGSLEPTASSAATTQRRGRGADLRRSPGDGMGTAAGRRRDRPLAFDGLEGPLALRPLTPAAR